MSLASEQTSQPPVSPVILDGHSGELAHSLLALSQHPAIWDGNIEAATATIAQTVIQNLTVNSCQVWLYRRDRTQFQQVANYSHPKQPIATTELTELIVTDHPVYFQMLSQRQWLVINTQISERNSTLQQQEQLPPYLQGQPAAMTAFLEVPIYDQNQVIGIISIAQHHCPRLWQTAEKSFMANAACLIALTLSQNRYQQQTQTLNQQKRQLSLATIEQQQAEQAWQESQRFIQGILDASSNILYVNDCASGSNYYVNGFMEHILGYSPDEIRMLGAKFLEKITHPGDINTIHQARQKLAQSKSGDIVENEYRLRHKKGTWHWMLCRETIFQWHPNGTPLQLLGTATDITVHKERAQALQQQNQALNTLAMVDGLTQVANRRAFDEFLYNAWAAGDHTPLTLILCDIDYFKRYNDTYGHQQGDKCLKLVAQALKKAVKRKPDIVARYGGEEFAIVLPNTNLSGAIYVANTIRQNIHALKIEHRLSDISEHLTLSMGIATVASTVYGSYHELITTADQGLYQAKADGRDCYAIGQTAPAD
ncbi:MAG: diguanylate cyclase [Cyanobacteria bacterium P01_D01_bin.156]